MDTLAALLVLSVRALAAGIAGSFLEIGGGMSPNLKLGVILIPVFGVG